MTNAPESVLSLMKTSAPIVVVAALTRDRPVDLNRLLRSLLDLIRPVGWIVRFMIVDNDPGRSAEALVRSAAAAFEGDLNYVSEPQPGIPAARNRALHEATSGEWKLLAFLDDDETPDPHWLSELISHYEKTAAVLIGGPYMTAAPEPSFSRWQKFLVTSIQARSRLAAWNNARRSRAGEYFVVSSGNWLGDVKWLREHGILFDEKYRVSGGSDAALTFAVEEAGGKISWCPAAIIYEHLPVERISVRAQLSRHFQQAIVMAKLSGRPALSTIPAQLARLFVGIGMMLVPIRPSFMVGVYLAGWSVGTLGSIFGAQSVLYKR